MSVVVVTDSTAYLPLDLAERAGVTIVPLHVIIDDRSYTEGVDLSLEMLGSALKSSARVSTSRPAPPVFLEVYERLADAGATGIVSVHLSAELSGTCDAALLAARQAPIPVTVVDSLSMGMGLGYGVLDAAAAAADGRSVSEVAAVARRRAIAATVNFYVHTLEYLRRGGRIGAASALLGSAFAIKPILALTDGHIEPIEKQRTTGRALARLVDLAVTAGDLAAGEVDVAVHHLDAADRAAKVADMIRSALAERHPGQPPVDPLLVELGAVAGAHLGPGTVAVVVSPHLAVD